MDANEILKVLDDVFGLKDIGKKKVVTINLKEEFDIVETNPYMAMVVELIKKRRGVADVKVYDEYVGAYLYRSIKVVSKLVVISSVAREFTSLNNFLTKYCSCRELKTDEVAHVDIWGKRNTYYEKGKTLLCHDADKCEEIKNWIADHRNYGDKVGIEVGYRRSIFDMDAYRGEREWDGEENYYLVVDVKTPTGRDKAHKEFYVY